MVKIISEKQYQVAVKALDLAVEMLQASGYPLIDRKYFVDMAKRKGKVSICLSCKTIFMQKKDEEYCALCSMDNVRKR